MKIGNIECYGVIYKITNIINNKCYIGQTIQGFNKRYHSSGKLKIEKIYNYHKYRMNHNDSYNDYLLKSIEKYGFDAFKVIEIFDIAFSKEELDIKEKCYINIFDSFNNGYNHTEGGEGAIGYKHSDGYKQFKSESMIGKNNPMYGKCPQDFMTKKQIIEWKNNISKSMMNINHRINKTEEELKIWNKKISESQKGENNSMYGKCGIKSPTSKSVICLTTKRIFTTVTEGGKYYDITRQSIGKCCNGKAKYAGKHKNKKLIWRYLIWKHNKKYRVKEED